MIPARPLGARRGRARLRSPVVLAVILLATAGGLPAGGSVAALSLLTMVSVILGRRACRRSVRAAARWRVINTAVLVTCLLLLFAGTPPVTVAVGLLGALQVHRAATGRTVRDDRTALLLALLQVLLACILSTSILLAPLFIALVVLSPIALALCQLDGEIARARDLRVAVAHGPPRALWLLGPGAALLCLALFILLPRISGRTAVHPASSPQRVTGFGDDVDLGDLGAMLESDALVMRVRVTDGRGSPWTGPLYLRGAVLDTFDGARWSSRAGAGGRWQPPRFDPRASVHQEIVQEPLSERAIFGLAEVVRVAGVGRRVIRDANGALRFQGAPDRLAYEVWSRVPSRRRSRLARARPDPRLAARSEGELAAAAAGTWLQLPGDLDPRIRALATRYAATAGPSASAWDRATAISGALERDYAYTLTPTLPDEPVDDPLAWFLFDGRAGHCELFATALAVMLRSQGIPSRLVNGFLGGEHNPLTGEVRVRQRDAHAWVEVNMGAEGWITLDATPAADRVATEASLWAQLGDWADRRWRGAVLEYALSDQVAVLARVGEAVSPPRPARVGRLPLPVLAGLIAVLLGAVGLLALGRAALGWLVGRRRRPRPHGRVEQLHARAWRQAARRGWHPPACLPPVAAAEWVRRRAGPAAEPLVRLCWLRYEVRYGRRSDAEFAPAARQAWAALRSGGLPRPPASAGHPSSD